MYVLQRIQGVPVKLKTVLLALLMWAIKSNTANIAYG
jgi:hypothetical protein